jgi:hypothetical protein
VQGEHAACADFAKSRIAPGAAVAWFRMRCAQMKDALFSDLGQIAAR